MMATIEQTLSCTAGQAAVVQRLLEHVDGSPDQHAVLTLLKRDGTLVITGTVLAPELLLGAGLLALRTALAGLQQDQDSARRTHWVGLLQEVLPHLEAAGIADPPASRRDVQ